MTIDIIYNIAKYNTAVLLTGDSDFHPLVMHLKQPGKFVIAVSTEPSISKELLSAADSCEDVLKIQEIWGKNLKYRAKK